MAKETRQDSAGSAEGIVQSIEWFRKEACVSFTADGKCLRLSPNWENLTGYSEKQSLGKKFMPLLREADRKRFLAFLASPQAGRKIRFCLQHADGHWEWFEAADWAIGEAGDITLLLHRITEEVKKDNALQRASLEAELALRGQSEFFAHISHELRTPLNAILGFSQMMHQGMFGEIANPRYRDYLQILERSGQELLGKINDLLEISSLSAGIDHLAEKNIPLPELMKTVVDTHARELFCRHLRVDADMPALAIVGDRVKLQQALSHLLKNAVKFSPEGGVITASARRLSDGRLSIALRDRGNGFSDEQLDYFRNQASSFSFLERNRKLFGFGLPLAQELIRLHEGSVTCRNSEEGGAEIVVTLPASRVIAVTHEAAPAPVRSKTHRRQSAPPPAALQPELPSIFTV